ncbi:hypothetical protein NDU88_012314 [Pleurodeles waltl]|uniref:Uncharacterized protein n=1 Tax=Pleurodeles waltl TaxID=8319 RepID=A0AAV7R2H8_PLEWA|nr:hypothetical protein NDU88_012314 [Pleurodeles waltl]
MIVYWLLGTQTVSRLGIGWRNACRFSIGCVVWESWYASAGNCFLPSRLPSEGGPGASEGFSACSSQRAGAAPETAGTFWRDLRTAISAGHLKP